MGIECDGISSAPSGLTATAMDQHPRERRRVSECSWVRPLAAWQFVGFWEVRQTLDTETAKPQAANRSDSGTPPHCPFRPRSLRQCSPLRSTSYAGRAWSATGARRSSGASIGAFVLAGICWTPLASTHGRDALHRTTLRSGFATKHEQAVFCHGAGRGRVRLWRRGIRSRSGCERNCGMVSFLTAYACQRLTRRSTGRALTPGLNAVGRRGPPDGR